MRREWSSWIRARQWSEFEKLAKADPSQGLADTIAELELGFPDKPDKRALRKVLYLLSQAGFEPREIEEFAAKLDVPIAPVESAFMVSSDGLGDTVITYGHEERGRVGWLVAHVNHRTGVTRAVEDATTLDEAQTKLIRLRNMTPTPFISAEVPVDFALSRLARAVSVTKSLPPVVAYWRACFPKEIPTTHPMDAFSRSQMDDEAMKSFLMDDETTQSWRLEMGSLAPALTELFDERFEQESYRQIAAEKWDSTMSATRKQLFNHETTDDHYSRLLDLAYLLHLKGLPHVDVVLGLADNLRDLGSQSIYANMIAAKSMLLYIHTLRAANAKAAEWVEENEARK